MHCKVILILLVVLNFSGCNKTNTSIQNSEPETLKTHTPKTHTQVLKAPVAQTSDSILLSKEDLKKYLIDKKINVEKIENIEGVNGVYEVNDKSGVFYIDQNKNVFFGMIINLETNENITLKKNIMISNGHLLPVSSNGTTPQNEANVPLQIKSAAGLDKVIQSMEQGIEKLKEQKKKLQLGTSSN